jgi:hypothetical protein
LGDHVEASNPKTCPNEDIFLKTRIKKPSDPIANNKFVFEDNGVGDGPYIGFSALVTPLSKEKKEIAADPVEQDILRYK